MQYEFQFDLQQKTALNAAISLWKKQEVKNDVTEFLESNTDELNHDDARDEWKELIQQIVESSDQNLLSPKFKGEWAHIVNNLGEKIYNWYLHTEISNIFPFGVEGDLPNYTDEILWTPHGTVDEVGIFKSYSSANLNPNLIKMYSIACGYALEDYITSLWQRMSVDMKDYCESEIDQYCDRHLLAYWKYRRDHNLPDLIKYFDIVQSVRSKEIEEYDFQYKLNYSPEENMFWVSVHEGNCIAVEYFWNKLTEEERSRSVRGCARLAVVRYDYYVVKQKSNKSHKKENYVAICVYLMNQMTADQRNSFFKTASMVEEDNATLDLEKDVKDKLLMMLLSAWPWQELFIPVLKDMMKFMTRKKETLSLCLQTIAKGMLQDHKLGYDVEHSKHQNMFQAVWCFIPGSIKQKITHQVRCSIITTLLEVWDLHSLKLMFNDPEIADVRNDYVEAGKRGFLKLILNDEYDLLDQLVEEIFRSAEEKKSFKQQVNIWSDSSPSKQYYTAEKLFNHRRNCADDDINLEGGISNVELCKYFIKWKRYDSVDKFLSWKFESEEARRECKSHLKNDAFMIKHIIEIWQSCEMNLDKANENTGRFLRLLLESEEEIKRFKEVNLIISDEGKLFVNYFVTNNFIQMMENFFFGCSSPADEVQRVKRKIGINIGHYICNHNILLGHTEKAESFVRWAFSEQESMHSFIKQFILSDDGMKACNGLLDKLHRSAHNKPCLNLKERSQKLSEFVDFWLKPLENIQEFRTKFTSRTGQSDDEMRLENYNMFIDLVDKLE